MSSNAQYDEYATELTRRFEEFTRWAMTNWPRQDFPLMRSDFEASRHELAQIIGPKLGEPDNANASADQQEGSAVDRGVQPRQYRDMNPMPWP